MQSPYDAPQSLTKQLAIESWAMCRYALDKGKPVPVSVVRVVENAYTAMDGSDKSERPDLASLVGAHRKLARLVAPATPYMLTMLAQRGNMSFLGTLPLVRRMLIVALVSLVGFIALSMSEYVNDPQLGNIFEAQGLPLLVNELFFLCAAALGAAFSGLFEAQQFIERKSFDASYESRYWVRFALGLVAGLIMATIINVKLSGEGGDDAMGMRVTAAGLALLGGFSSSVIYRILQRLVGALESLVAGELDARVQNRAQQAEDRADRKIDEERMRMTRDLVQLRQEASQDGSGALARQIDSLIDRSLEDPEEEMLAALDGESGGSGDKSNGSAVSELAVTDESEDEYLDAAELGDEPVQELGDEPEAAADNKS